MIFESSDPLIRPFIPCVVQSQVRLVEQRQAEKRSARPQSAAAVLQSSAAAAAAVEESSSGPVDAGSIQWFTQPALVSGATAQASSSSTANEAATFPAGPLKGKPVPVRSPAHQFVPVSFHELPNIVESRGFLIGDPAAGAARSFTTTNRAEFVGPAGFVALPPSKRTVAAEPASPRFAISSAGLAKGRAFTPRPAAAGGAPASPAAAVALHPVTHTTAAAASNEPKWTPRSSYADSYVAPKV